MTFPVDFTLDAPTRPGWYWLLHSNGERVLPILVVGEPPRLFASGIVLEGNPMLHYTFLPLEELVHITIANCGVGRWAGPFDGPFDWRPRGEGT